MFQVNPLLIHMEFQALFSLKHKGKKIKMLFAAIFVWGFKGKSCS